MAVDVLYNVDKKIAQWSVKSNTCVVMVEMECCIILERERDKERESTDMATHECKHTSSKTAPQSVGEEIAQDKRQTDRLAGERERAHQVDKQKKVTRTKCYTITQDAGKEDGARASKRERDQPFGKTKRAVCSLLNHTF